MDGDSMIPYKEFEPMVTIECDTGRAVIESREWNTDKHTYRKPNMDDVRDYYEVHGLYRRMVMIEAMNRIIRGANDENISLGIWLSECVADGDTGLNLYDYANDREFWDSCTEWFVRIIKEDVNDVNDLFYW